MKSSLIVEDETSVLIRQLSIQSGMTKLLPWQRRAFNAMARIVGHETFPCYFAHKAFRKGCLKFCFAKSPTDDESMKQVSDAMLSYLNQRKVELHPHLSALVIMFEPEEISLMEYHCKTWQALQFLVDHDPCPQAISPQTIMDPNESGWMLSFGGEGWFVNSSNPAHRNRQSRNLGPSLTLIAKPRADFDLVVGPGKPAGGQIRNMIRDRTTTFDTYPASNDIGNFHEGNAEWRGYCLFDNSEMHWANCPLELPIGDHENRGEQC